MRTACTIIRRAVAASLLVFACPAPLSAQSPLREVKITPVSDLRSDWLNEGAESPNGRFFVLRGYADDAFLRYDRLTRQWASAKNVTVGRHVRWSPNGRFLAFAKLPGNLHDRSVWVLPMDSATGLPRGSARRISTSAGSWPAWSPDGRRIAFSVQDSGRFRLVSVPFNGGDENVLYEDRGTGGDVAWSPDGRYLFAGHRPTLDTQITWVRVNVATKHVDTLPFGALRILGYSPDGKLVAHYDGNRSLIVISSATDGRTVQRLRVPNQVTPTGWSRSTPNAITALQHVVPSNVQRVSLADGRIESLTPVDSSSAGDVRYSPDGRQFAYARPESGAFRLYVANSDGSSLRGIGTRGDIGAFEWSPSGKAIAHPSGGLMGGIHVVDVETGGDRELIRSGTGHGMPEPELAWRSDGRAVRYIWHPRGILFADREVREVTTQGKDRVLAARVPEGDAHFINDTLLLFKTSTGIAALDLRTGDSRSLYKGPMRGWSEFGVSADGTWLAFSAEDNGAAHPRLLSLTTGESRRIPYSLTGELGTVLFHPDGRHLIGSACITCQSGVEKWDVVLIPMSGESPRVLTAGEGSYTDFGNPQSSRDGRNIIFEAERSYNTRIVTLHLPRSE